MPTVTYVIVSCAILASDQLAYVDEVEEQFVAEVSLYSLGLSAIEVWVVSRRDSLLLKVEANDPWGDWVCDCNCSQSRDGACAENGRQHPCCVACTIDERCSTQYTEWKGVDRLMYCAADRQTAKVWITR